MSEHDRNGDSHRCRSGGFTLVELLVAISILAIVAVLGWRGLDSIVRARVALSANLDQTRAMQLSFAQMQSDCTQVVPSTLLPQMQHMPLVADQSRFMLVRYVFADDLPTRLQVVTYRARDGRLTRRESTPTRDLNELDSAWQTAVSDGDAADALVLQSGVGAMSMRIWQSNVGWRTPPGPGETGGTPPTGLEVSLQLSGRSTSMLKVFLLGAA